MSFFLLTMQSYGDFLPIPRKIPNSSLTCSDKPSPQATYQANALRTCRTQERTQGTVPAVI